MDTLHENTVHLLDLPDEMLLAIFGKLKTVDVLYSVVGVNQRLDRLVLDPLYTRYLDLQTISSLSLTSPRADQMLDRICTEILPRIPCNVKKLTLGPKSIKRVLLTADYAQLQSISLVDFSQETLLQNLTDDSILTRIVNQRITHLNVSIDMKTKTEWPKNAQTNGFAILLALGKCLVDFTFHQLFYSDFQAISLASLPATSCVSSTLTHLNITVNRFDDCLFLLDGRLSSLSSFIVTVGTILASSSTTDNTKKLPCLKRFSLKSGCVVPVHNSGLLPLIHRMSNLQDLTLFFPMENTGATMIDGTYLQNNILVHLPQLHKFTFSLRYVFANLPDETHLPCNEDIQRSFLGRGYGKVGSCIDYDPCLRGGSCHMYSIPYSFEVFVSLTNCFQSDTFDRVRTLVLNDKCPFEHEFFERIARDFPNLRALVLANLLAQKNKLQDSHSSIITFPRLTILNFHSAHVDYVEQFLFNTKTRLPRLLLLLIKYELLVSVTENFTNDAARITCARVKSLVIEEPIVRSKDFQSYFPSLRE